MQHSTTTYLTVCDSYSFTLKAKAKTGDGVQEGYYFEKPIVISMLCKSHQAMFRVVCN